MKRVSAFLSGQNENKDHTRPTAIVRTKSNDGERYKEETNCANYEELIRASPHNSSSTHIGAIALW